MTKGIGSVYDYWKKNMEPGGFTLSVRIVKPSGGKPGDVSLFLLAQIDVSRKG